MSKNILILSGSPRKGGNSDILCDLFMEQSLIHISYPKIPQHI